MGAFTDKLRARLAQLRSIDPATAPEFERYVMQQELATVVGEPAFISGGQLVDASGSPVSGAGNGNTFFAMGHSRLAQAFNGAAFPNLSYGYATIITQMLGQRISWLGSSAVVGNTIAQVIANQLPQLQALATKPDYVLLEIGYNDFSVGATASYMQSQYTTLLAAITSLGIKVVAVTDSPGSTLTTAQQLQQQAFNSWLVNQGRTSKSLIVVDGYSCVVDGATGAMDAATVQADGIHHNPNGAMAIARELFTALDPIIPKRSVIGVGVSASAQLIFNPGVSGNNASGANGWTAASTSVTFNGAISGAATSGTLAANWAGATGAYAVLFSNGDVRAVTLTNAATTATWSTGLSSGATASASTGVSGNGPSYWNVSSSTGAVATASIVSRSASAYAPQNKASSLLRLTANFTASDATVSAVPAITQNIRFIPFSPSAAVQIGYRVMPTVDNGAGYVVTTAGTLGAADDSASWSTTPGAVVQSGAGTARLTVVDKIVPGDTVVFVAEVFGAVTAGAAGAYVQLAAFTAAFANLGSKYGGRLNIAAYGANAGYMPGQMVLQTEPFTLPSNTGIVQPLIILSGAAGGAITAEIGSVALRKVG